MKALVKVKQGPGNVELIDIPEPFPGPNEVKIEIVATGVCGTDIHIRNDRFMSSPPVVLGHEIAGTVVEVGEKVNDIQLGEHVTINPGAGISCGKCSYCRSGYYMFCQERKGIGSKLNGGFSRYIVVREDIVYKLPQDIKFEVGALCEPLACAVQAVMEQSRVRAADWVYVSGPGLMGLLATQLSIAEGGKVIVGGLPDDEDRLMLAKKFGAHEVVVVGKDDINEVVQDLSKGQGMNIALECAGSGGALNTCLNVLKPQGQLTQIGIMNGAITIDYNTVFFKQLTVKGSFAANWRSWDKALHLINQEKVQLAPLVTSKLPLIDWEIAFYNLVNKVGVRTVLYPGN
jgi:L-iditol 2-dehydrogenase